MLGRGLSEAGKFNFEGERPALFCGQHKAKGMACPAHATLCTEDTRARLVALVFQAHCMNTQHVCTIALANMLGGLLHSLQLD